MVRTRSGLVALVKGVREYFDAVGVTANVSIGWKERAKQINQGTGRANRVVFTPSDDSGKGGKIVAVKQPGTRQIGDPVTHTVRSLRNWERFVVVSVWAADTTKPNDEEAQLEAVESLFESVLQAVNTFAAADAVWGDVSWTTEGIELSFGREMRAGLVFRHPLFDLPVEVVYPGLNPITKTLEPEAG